MDFYSFSQILVDLELIPKLVFIFLKIQSFSHIGSSIFFQECFRLLFCLILYPLGQLIARLLNRKILFTITRKCILHLFFGVYLYFFLIYRSKVTVNLLFLLLKLICGEYLDIQIRNGNSRFPLIIIHFLGTPSIKILLLNIRIWF